jgi:hypothetical protein
MFVQNIIGSIAAESIRRSATHIQMLYIADMTNDAGASNTRLDLQTVCPMIIVINEFVMVILELQ